ncbi:precorrin-2 C(20)-methyltransferase [Desulfogranum marinum]|jgi:precorrin-2/cobalt-factor-2 C20-methyltransferase|uniref:precorrin-2 C(20)-methyltransferase n=1 Tax=Desulfogranum marinum TaxID=453220 RepID=UPI0029C6D8EB|nr:precorrin-2 C(20)-methyltransferase [Desulfogranum marinum]
MSTENTKPIGRLYLVGIGPGDPELITYKAGRILEDTAIWAVPKSKNTNGSSALQIAGGLIDASGKKILDLDFAMKKVFMGETLDPRLLDAWRVSAAEVIKYLDLGEDVVFPTLGDPTLYSTAFYLLPMIQEKRPDVQVTVVPGITAMAACAAGLSSPLALGNDVLTVVPAAFDDDRLRDILTTLDAIVLMKVHRKMDALVALLTELDMVDNAVLFERFGLPGQTVYTDIRTAVGKDLHYFSTMVIRKKHIQVEQ